MKTAKSNIKLDSFNKKILSVLHTNADMSNQKLADKVGLSPSACFQRVKGLREAGYFVSFVAELDLDKICSHVLAYVEFTLENNNPEHRAAFESAIAKRVEFMDCVRITGDTDYISFTGCSNVQDLNALCDSISSDKSLGIKKVRTRIVLERSKWYLGYPLDKLKWLD